jgi:branched-chain amino acid transport system permease protein
MPQTDRPLQATTKPARQLSDIWLLLLIWLALLAIPFIAPNAYIVSLANMALINLILIASLNLLMGFGGQISLGHAGFFGVGAYASGILNVKLGISAWLGLPIAALVTGLVALVIGLPALRLRGLYLSMATLGSNAILVVLFNQLIPLTGGPNGLLGVRPFSLFGFRLDSEPKAFALVWLAALLVMLTAARFAPSRPTNSAPMRSGSTASAPNCCFS